MICKELNGLKWLEFNIFQPIPHLKARVYQRNGGSSQQPFDSLNLSQTVGDESDRVDSNLKLIENSLESSQLALMDQVHGTDISIVDTLPHFHPQCDGIITNKPDIALTVRHADCQPTLIFDPIKQVVAAVHSGWKGSCQNIYKKTIDKLRARYGSKPENLLVGIGPSLGPCHSEFIHYKQEIPEQYWKYQIKPTYFDFWAISQKQLQDEGVVSEHIEIAQVCTICSPEFFSYRRDKVTGRNPSVIQLTTP